MESPRICAAIVDNDLEAVKEIEPLVDLFEVRIDLTGEGWPELVRRLGKPWIACNRISDEGGSWKGSEEGRIEELLKAVELGASIVDVELITKNLDNTTKLIKKRAKCLLSSHNLTGTPSLTEMKQTVQKQLEAGADICKVATTATNFEDNMTVLQLIGDTHGIRLVSFAMGPLGYTSRILCPLAGGDFTYASIETGRESAPGQITVKGLRRLYEIMGGEK